MANTNTGPREYKTLPIANTVVTNPVRYMSKPDGWVMDTADFTELSYFLGYKFEPRGMYTIWTPEGVSRGGHMESRSKLVTVISGLLYFAMVDMRPGTDQGKISEFYLGDGEKSIGWSVLVPEGVVDYFVPIGGAAMTHGIGDRLYNKFDNSTTLDMFDPEIGFKNIPKDVVHHVPEGEELNLLNLKQFIESIK
jgi:dTDP-4-dehydrorhamnose 3,5-epimerase-like enzyme